MAALAGALRSGALRALVRLDLENNKIGDKGLASFASAIGSGALPALVDLDLEGIPASAAAKEAVRAAHVRSIRAAGYTRE